MRLTGLERTICSSKYFPCKLQVFSAVFIINTVWNDKNDLNNFPVKSLDFQ